MPNLIPPPSRRRASGTTTGAALGVGAARALAIATAIALVACSPAPQTTLSPTTDVGRIQYDLERTFFLAGLAVFVFVETYLVWTIVRYRARPSAPGAAASASGAATSDGGTSDSKGADRLELTWTLIPAVLLALVAVPTVQGNFTTQARAPRGALPVQVIGHQWWWEFRYPTLGVVTANELHLPAGTPASLTLTSADVMHGFWLPRLGGKRDALPGHITTIVWTPDSLGTTSPGQCTQFCGAQHGRMGMRVTVEPRPAFDAWVRAQQAVPATLTDVGTGARAPLAAGSLAAAGALVYAGNACIGCHTVAHVSAGQVAPNLTHVASRATLVAGMLPNTPANLALWIHDPQSVKPGALMPRVPLTSADLRALVAYLETLR